MFLKIYKLNKAVFTSGATRNSYYFYNSLNLQGKLPNLSLHKKWNSGRNDSGRTVIRTKSSLLQKTKYVKVNFKLRYFKLGFISSFQFIPFKNKLLSLVFFSNGSYTYYLSAENHGLFSFMYYNPLKKRMQVKMGLNSTLLMLFQIKKLSFVSCLELVPGKGAQYTRSSGTKSRISKFDGYNHSVLLQLSSGVKKSFSYYSFVMLGRLAMVDHSRCLNGKAGYWRSFGVKSTVRGVAMNAVDHPHGGRTKSIKYPRTPWGKTTKFK